jgi:hypothetical protein
MDPHTAAPPTPQPTPHQQTPPPITTMFMLKKRFATNKALFSHEKAAFSWKKLALLPKFY